MTIHFVDVSLHDRNRRGGPLDWDRIANAGLGHIMAARVTYGDPQGYSPSSPYARELIQGAKAAGYTVRLGYHNLIHGDQASINRQVDYLRRTLDLTGATGAMADIEKYEELVGNGLYPRWSDVVRFHDRWYALDNRPMLWYIPHWIWASTLGAPDLRPLRGPLTASNYPDGTGSYPNIYRACGGDSGPGWKPYGGRTPDAWQYTSAAVVPGNGSRTDVNAFKGTVAQFTKLVSAPVAAKPPEPSDLVMGGMVL